MPKKTLWIALLVLLPLVLAGGLYFLTQETYQPYGTRLLNPRPVDTLDFTLTAHDGSRKSLRDFEGKVVLIFFGFVNCPDVCPTTLLELSKVYKALTPAEQQRVQVLLITVDPERDTLQKLASYVTFFDKSFIGLTGSPEEIAAVAKKYGVFYQKSGVKSPTEYNVDPVSYTHLRAHEAACALFTAAVGLPKPSGWCGMCAGCCGGEGIDQKPVFMGL